MEIKKVLVAAPVHDVLLEGLADHGYECVIHESITQGAAHILIKGCVGVITSTRLMLDKALLDAAPRLAWIGRMGSGMEVVDMEYVAQKGIACYSSPEGNCDAVGEHAVGMMLALMRRIAWSHIEMKQGIWLRDENRGSELDGKTIGIIGFGHTGAAFAKKLRGFDMNIIAYDKYNPSAIPANIKCCDTLQEIYDTADIVSFHVPLQADTVHYFNQDFIQRMQKPFILVNTARGQVVDTAALMQGLNDGKVTGACLDVYEQEPLSAMNVKLRGFTEQLAAMPNVILTPHIAGYTFEAVYKMSKTLLDKIIRGAKTSASV
jgi:D-3-phosphoglycerate dehydrogenase